MLQTTTTESSNPGASNADVPDFLTILTIGECAKLTRVSEAHLYRIINGKVEGLKPLPVMRLGRRRLVRRSSLETWLSQNDVAVSDPTTHRMAA